MQRSDQSLPQACIIHLTGNALALQIIYCMESSADVLNATQPVGIPLFV